MQFPQTLSCLYQSKNLLNNCALKVNVYLWATQFSEHSNQSVTQLQLSQKRVDEQLEGYLVAEEDGEEATMIRATYF